MAANLDDVMVEAVSLWLGSKIQRNFILNQNGANLAYLHGRDMAHRLGLTPEERDKIMAFPPTVNIRLTENLQETPPVTPPPPAVVTPSPTPTPPPTPPATPPPIPPATVVEEKPSLVSRIAPLLLGLAVGGGAIGAACLLTRPEPTKPTPTTPSPATSDAKGDVGLQIE